MAFIDAKKGWSGEWSRRKGNRAFPFFLPTWNGNRDLAYLRQKRKKGLYIGASFRVCPSVGSALTRATSPLRTRTRRPISRLFQTQQQKRRIDQMTIMKDDVESIRTMQDAARAAQKRIAALDKADDTSEILAAVNSLLDAVVTTWRRLRSIVLWQTGCSRMIREIFP